MHDIDVFMVTETKLDNSIPFSQFILEHFSTPFRLDRSKNGSDIISHVRS